ncbi:MAG: glucokinase [Caulobacter sp.]|nr:glucokinase [Caulobacter sp.]
MTAAARTQRLVGDVGGTNCRFAIVETGEADAPLADPRGFEREGYENLEAAIDHYLDGRPLPAEAVIAVAGPVTAGRADLTNGRWKMSEGALKAHGFRNARLINDYEALALSVPRLGAEDLGDIGDVRASGGTVAIIGAGTGLGVGALVRDARGEAVAVTEGGHIAFAPTDETEVAILAILTARFGRVSVERLLSGPGLVNLYEALSRLAAVEPLDLSPEDVVHRATHGDDRQCAEALERFCRIYGAVAGDFALAFGASGGVYLGGGIAPRLIDTLRNSGFRQAFEAKGRFQGYCAAIPTRVILHPHAALLGAASAPV